MDISKVNMSGSLKCFKSDRADFVINALSNVVPVNRFGDGCDMREFRSKGNNYLPIPTIQYLPLNNSNPHLKGNPSSPVGFYGPLIFRSMGRYRPTLGNRGKYGTNVSLGKENKLTKCGHSRPPDDELRPQNCQMGPSFDKWCGLCPPKQFDGCGSFLAIVTSSKNLTPITLSGPELLGFKVGSNAFQPENNIQTPSCLYCGEMRKQIEFIYGKYLLVDNSNPPKWTLPPSEGSYGAPTFWFQWFGIGQL